MTEPQRRVLATLKDGSKPVWQINLDSGSHASGYRVIAALYSKGMITCRRGSDWYRLTDAGRAALGVS
jgi:DNA-binding PadR family transcriptional regulator